MRRLYRAVVCAGVGACFIGGAYAAIERKISFDDVAAGALPGGWTADATSGGGKLAEWKVVADPAAPSRGNVLSITRINDGARGVFNLFWNRQLGFKDGEIEVKVRGNTGDIDQGGGPIWRVKDANNYYIARYNPLEQNFRLYYVKNGGRKMLASAEGLNVARGEWFTIRMVHRGDQIEGWFNGKKLLTATDSTLPEQGGVGVWSKADAASSFDDIVVKP